MFGEKWEWQGKKSRKPSKRRRCLGIRKIPYRVRKWPKHLGKCRQGRLCTDGAAAGRGESRACPRCPLCCCFCRTATAGSPPLHLLPRTEMQMQPHKHWHPPLPSTSGQGPRGKGLGFLSGDNKAKPRRHLWQPCILISVFPECPSPELPLSTPGGHCSIVF